MPGGGLKTAGMDGAMDGAVAGQRGRASRPARWAELRALECV